MALIDFAWLTLRKHRLDSNRLPDHEQESDMSLNRCLPMLAVLALVAPVAHAQYSGYPGYGNPEQAGVVRCESIKGRTNQCSIDTRYGVRMTRQLSDSACDEGRTWGLNRSGIWVTGGCRAEFVMGDGRYGRNRYGNNGNGYGGYGDNRGQRFVCESRDGYQNYCPVYGGGRARIYRQVSRNDCDEGRTWGQDRRGVWVSGGCRAEFVMTAYGDRWNDRDDDRDWGNSGQAFRCESIHGRQNFCNADTRWGVRLVRKISGNACDEGRTWGATRDGVWVSQGCRADFMTGR